MAVVDATVVVVVVTAAFVIVAVVASVVFFDVVLAVFGWLALSGFRFFPQAARKKSRRIRVGR